ncbi:hypothetical protein HanIR_Chr06g0291051 [Helianthus annuus]|nr:hypothetical protein HanIR_Chr06g0291051 [Helianthus annuus]
MTKHKARENFLLFNLNGILLFCGIKRNLGINVQVQVLVPDNMCVSITWSPSDGTCSRVPLHKPFFRSIFLDNVTGTLNFGNYQWFGKPKNITPFRTSGEYRLASKLL